MKIIKGLLVGIAAVLISANVYAQIQTDVDYKTGNVTVTGAAENRSAAVKVYSPDESELVFMDQVVPNQQGNYTFSFNTDAVYGPYKMYVNDDGNVQNQDVYFDVFVPKFSIKNSNSKEEIKCLDDLGVNDGIDISLEFDHNPTQSKVTGFNMKMFCGVYDINGTLINVKQSENIVSVSDSDMHHYGTEVSFTHDEIINAKRIKLFLWENGKMLSYTGKYEMDKLPHGKSLKLLGIGNSHFENGTRFIYPMAKALGIDDLIVAFAYAGGSTLETHYNLIGLGTPYLYYKNSGSGFDVSERKTVYDIADEDWDIILMQQGSTVAGIESSFDEKFISRIYNTIKTYSTNTNVEVGYHMTFAHKNGYEKGFPNDDTWDYYNRDSDTMFNMMASALKNKIYGDERFKYILYSGTAIQNARHSDVLSAWDGKDFSIDYLHVNDHGCVIESLAWLKGLGYDISVLDTSCLSEYPQLSDITEEYFELMKTVVEKAYENPFKITDIDEEV